MMACVCAPLLLRFVQSLSALLAATPVSELEGSFSYKNTRGKAMQAQRSFILLHVVNHATHHRGQISVSRQAVPQLVCLSHLDVDGGTQPVPCCACSVFSSPQAALTQLGQPAPALDLLYMLNDKA
jgi:uncharacterized damage-inducible protein DinB